MILIDLRVPALPALPVQDKETRTADVSTSLLTPTPSTNITIYCFVHIFMSLWNEENVVGI